jgi:hypothetical protein
MKRAILTSGLFLVMIALTSFTTPSKNTIIKNTQTEIKGATVPANL